MADLFTTSEVSYGGAIHSQKGIIGAAGVAANIGVLMQNMQLQYSQQVTRVYELGVAGRFTKAYYVAGRAQGQLQVAHIVGPNVALKSFYDQYSNVCNARDNNIAINLSPNTCDLGLGPVFRNTVGRLAYTAKNCVLTQIGMSVSVQDFLINENSTLMFIGLDYTGN